MRESGWYWVKYQGDWQPAEYNDKVEMWFIISLDFAIEDSDLDEIGDAIEIPEKYREADKKSKSMNTEAHVTVNGKEIEPMSGADWEKFLQDSSRAPEPLPEAEKEPELDWAAAEEHLREVEQSYMDIGQAGLPALIISIWPIKNRFMIDRERTKELYDEIMGLE
jgi:hypothetical protein